MKTPRAVLAVFVVLFVIVFISEGGHLPCADSQEAGPLSASARSHMDGSSEVNYPDSLRADGIDFDYGPRGDISLGETTIGFRGRGSASVQYYDGERVVVASSNGSSGIDLRDFLPSNSTTYVYVLSVVGGTIRLERRFKVCAFVSDAFLAPDGLVIDVGIGGRPKYELLPMTGR